jgi:DNA-binding SARP family transcriptional activator
MLLSAKTAAPSSTDFLPRRHILQEAADHAVTLLVAPDGYLMVDALAGALEERGRTLLWLRVGPEDRDPAMLLFSLISAARRIVPGAGEATLELMRRRPGPLHGWPALYSHLAEELAAALPMGCALVVEGVDLLDGNQPTLGLFGAYLLPELAQAMACILIAGRDIPRPLLPAHTLRRGPVDLEVTTKEISSLASQAQIGLPEQILRRAVGLLGGRADSIISVCRLAARLGVGPTTELTTHAVSGDDLLLRTAAARLRFEREGARRALDLSRRLDLFHPELCAAAGALVAPDHAWLLPLSNGWSRLRSPWPAALRRGIRAAEQAPPELLERAVAFFEAQGALTIAVPLALEQGDYTQGARLIEGSVETLMGLGMWELLSGWLARLPQTTLHDWPWLLYAQGEIAAARRDITGARRSFATSSIVFASATDAEGSCQSLLAESTLALWQGQYDVARSRAVDALSRAEATGLAWQYGWAAWQLCCLAVADDDPDAALVYLDRALSAAAGAGELPMADLLRLAEGLMVRHRELAGQREQHRQAYFAFERAAREVEGQLRQLVVAPPLNLDQLLLEHRWAITPLMLRLSTPEPDELNSPERQSLWHGLLRTLGLLRRSSPRAPARSSDPAVAIPPALPGERDEIPTALEPAHVALVGAVATPTASLVLAGGERNAPWAALQAAAVGAVAEVLPAPTLAAHLLGQFRVILNDQAVENWPSGRGRGLLKYLLVHRDRATPRDVLMDLFWPDSSPEDARNSLNVALHGLRQSLRSVTDISVVEYLRKDGTYRLSPMLQIWLDVEEFEEHVRAGRRSEDAGAFPAAASSYEQAATLYQGDYLADDPYEEWPVLRREQLRLAYLDTLDRLSQISFGQGQYSACANLCQLILARDNCREDAHARLIRCYSRLGQRPLALRQYQACVQALSTELGIEPSAATAQLAERIRRREHI